MSTSVRQKVLIVDDSPLARKLLVQMLADLEITVVAAESGEEAVKVFQEHDFALILLDVMMVGISGLEAAKNIRALDHENSEVPIIFVTATSTDANSVFEGYEAGAVDYLHKPVDKKTLCSKVSVFCRIRAQRETIQIQLEEIRQKNEQLEKSLAEIKVLQGLVPICASCKNVRDDTGYWHSIEQYFTENAQTEFSHSICPNCSEKLYPELALKRKSR